MVPQEHHQPEANPEQFTPTSQKAQRHEDHDLSAFLRSQACGHGPAFRLDTAARSLLEYLKIPEILVEDVMASVPKELLRSVAETLARVPVDPGDLPSIQAQLGAQLDGLAGLDGLDLQNVEPATVIVPSAEAPHGR